MSNAVGPVQRTLSPAAAGLLTFLAAACVLVLEIAAARLLAPFVGVSLTTYTGIIGVILAGIALGAWAGGRAADAVGPDRVLGPAFVVGGLAAVAAVPIIAVLGPVAITPGAVRTVVLSATAFLVPSAILSAVGPAIVRATLVDVTSSGSIVGRLSAMGTLGAITGTYLTGFVLLGLFPTQQLIVLTGALLVAVGVLLAWRARRLATVALGVAAVLVIAPIALASPRRCDVESRYYCMALVEDPTNPTGRTLVLDGLSHAYVDTADPTVLRFAYIRRFADVAAGPIEQRSGRVEALHIGGGGFSFPRYLMAEYPDSRHTVLELDPEIVAVNRSRLGLEASDGLDVVIGDARRTIGDLPADRFDLVFGDAFGGLAVPWHLTTREFLMEIDRVLKGDGMYVMNLIDYPPLQFVRAEAATARSLFEHVAVVADPPRLAGDAGGNVVLVASHVPIDAEAIAARIAAQGEATEAGLLVGDGQLREFVTGSRVLTDDYAPVDLLLGR